MAEKEEVQVQVGHLLRLSSWLTVTLELWVMTWVPMAWMALELAFTQPTLARCQGAPAKLPVAVDLADHADEGGVLAHLHRQIGHLLHEPDHHHRGDI